MIRRQDAEAVLDPVEDPGQEPLLLADGCVRLRQGPFLLFPLDGGAEDFRCSPQGGDLVLGPLNLARVIGKPDEAPPALAHHDRHDGNGQLLVEGKISHFPIGKLPDRTENRPSLTLFVDPPRKADCQF